MSSAIGRSQKLVVKVGTAVLSRALGGLDKTRISELAAELSRLHAKGYQVVVVSSGAIGAGMDSFGWKTRPTALRDKQAAAAVGQVVLMEAYRAAFGAHGLTVAQMLLTRADLDDRTRYLNARNTLNGLLERRVVPIINENDTVATEEIQFGDNDALAAQVAVKLAAKKLFLLTDVDGLLKEFGPDAKPLTEVFQITPDIEALVRGGAGSRKSVGGMKSKIQAAAVAMASGVEVWIASGRRSGILEQIVDGQGLGTRFKPWRETLDARRRWIAFGRRVNGTLVVDDGAVAALVQNKRSLLPSGVLRVDGGFQVGDTVKVMSAAGAEVARGSVAYSAADLRKIQGKKTSDIETILGRPAPHEVIHRNNLVIFPAAS
jgi:glutamate 5-kinase